MAIKDPAEPHNAKWTTPVVTAALSKLVERKSTHQSSNRWKSTVWPDVVKVVHAVNLDADPPKDQMKLISKLEDKTFELYLFVEKFSSSGWDEDEKHASNTPEYIKDFIKVHGKKYVRCFKKVCPFYQELNELYNGFRNRATGEDVVHFRKPRKCIIKENTATTSVTSASPAASPAASTSNLKSTGSVNTAGDVTLRTPMLVLNNTQPDGEAMGSLNNYDDELRLSPLRLLTKRTRAESDDDDATNPKPKQPRVKSNSSTGSSTAKRNAEAGSQIALSFNKLLNTMAKPIVTTTDVSYVDDVMRVPEDKTLLPLDPRGKLFNIVSAYLTESPVQARLFVITQSAERRKGMIAGILEAAGVILPKDY
ncbi:hypothetical protein DFH08DRAFT_976600 [Mycena albidolilacea]|uniref:Uncharacterized protein n=1 Tax=Mycena albidolilacea TaxID=1033008 RepID=A0AAD6Z331_9AGAR|nr:hypothetical protein DFH08DRAFT_976600 [Mycena albidolilacea]